jgi:hypothetical protein
MTTAGIRVEHVAHLGTGLNRREGIYSIVEGTVIHALATLLADYARPVWMLQSTSTGTIQADSYALP